jgi:integrase
VRGTLYLGRPKTAASVRDIHLPPFLVEMLHEMVGSHDHDLVFCGARGAFLRRSSMSRRVWRPAVNGNPATGTAGIVHGMHFHDLRHTHKTWLIEDDIPEIVQARRLGHRLPGVPGIYSHVTPAMTARVTNRLQARWTAAQSPTHTQPRHLYAA